MRRSYAGLSPVIPKAGNHQSIITRENWPGEALDGKPVSSFKAVLSWDSWKAPII
jgi:hypothetical protein